ncbi:MAG: hypothetical protein PHW11_01785 [Anaerolineaceae bacterium]|jgi:hypothetical protein|nr:hypothetical protein [Anaerolineaceae bacterium]MDD4041960.1 hypothetical protein [Anaerolineaceae bacterium]
MGRTIASINQTWQEEEAALNRFKRALRKDDQVILDELLVMSRLHLAEASYASNLYPLDMYLIAILLEVYKQLKTIQHELHSPDQHKDQSRIEEEDVFLKLITSYLKTSGEQPQEDTTEAQEEDLSVVEIEDERSYADFEEAP